MSVMIEVRWGGDISCGGQEWSWSRWFWCYCEGGVV